jgi:hypothetical protein
MVKRFTRYGVSVCAALAMVALVPGASGQVVYDDGNAHAIPGDPGFTNGQSIALQNASGLQVNTGATVDGGDAAGTQFAGGGIAITAAAGTNINQSAGAVTGGSAAATAGFSPTSPVSARGGTGVSTAGAFAGGGGTVTGGSAKVEGTVNRIEARGGTGLQLNPGATATLAGAALTGGDGNAGRDGSGGAVLTYALGGTALRVVDAGPVVISAGSFTGGEAFAESFNFDSGGATGQGGLAVDVSGGSTLTIDGGTFRGGNGSGIVTFTASPGVGIGGGAVRVSDAATLTINAGTFQAGSAGAGTVPGTEPITTAEAALAVAGSGASGALRMTINGGTFAGLHGLQTSGVSPNMTAARIDILGGDLVGATGGGTGSASPDLSLANPDLSTTIFGSDFLLDGAAIPFGPVTATTGTLAGLLANGSPFEWTFERPNDAPLTVAAAVPEPAALSLLALGGVALLARRRA